MKQRVLLFLLYAGLALTLAAQQPTNGFVAIDRGGGKQSFLLDHYPRLTLQTADGVTSIAVRDTRDKAQTGVKTCIFGNVSEENCPPVKTTDGATINASQLPYVWEGETFTQSGSKTKTLKTADGCDSIVTFTLTVLTEQQTTTGFVAIDRSDAKQNFLLGNYPRITLQTANGVTSFHVQDIRDNAMPEVKSCVFGEVTESLPLDIVLKENESAMFYEHFAEEYNGLKVNTATLERQFTKGKWATLCLPFNVNRAMLTALGLYNRVFEFRYAESTEDGTIQVYFVTARSLEAGKGYIVNPNAQLAEKTSFVFPNVTINTDASTGDITTLRGYNDASGRGNLYLVGSLRTGLLQGKTTGNTYLGLKNNQIYYPNQTQGTAIRAYRGFFRSTAPVNASRVRIIADGESVTELEVVGTAPSDWSDKSDTPARKYIHNGVLYIERNGILYDAQGKRLKQTNQ